VSRSNPRELADQSVHRCAERELGRIGDADEWGPARNLFRGRQFACESLRLRCPFGGESGVWPIERDPPRDAWIDTDRLGTLDALTRQTAD
jgi:hypothetical protein